MEALVYKTLPYMVFKWIHFIAGVTWIGVLYYFNFIQLICKHDMHVEVEYTRED